MNLIRNYLDITYLFYPVSMILFTLLSYILYQMIAIKVFSVLIPVWLAMALIFTFERIKTHHQKLKPPLRTYLTEWSFLLFNSFITVQTAKILLLYLISLWNQEHQLIQHRFHLLLDQMPWLLQFIIAVLLADLMVYITHRFLHQSKHFWKIHLIHHTSTHMNLFTSSRTHPLNAFITYFFEFGILMLLGFDQHIILTWSCFMSINGLFQHCNVDLKFGILNRFVSTAELHRIHHSTNKQDFNYNFGTTTSIWDQFFGTYKESFEDGIEYGVSNIRIRENFWELLKYPFKGITFRKVITPPGPADNS